MPGTTWYRGASFGAGAGVATYRGEIVRAAVARDDAPAHTDLEIVGAGGAAISTAPTIGVELPALRIFVGAGGSAFAPDEAPTIVGAGGAAIRVAPTLVVTLPAPRAFVGVGGAGGADAGDDEPAPYARAVLFLESATSSFGSLVGGTMLQKIKRGSTAVSIPIYVMDKSVDPPEPLTGLSAATPGLVVGILRDGDVAKTNVTLTAGTPGTWSSGGFSAVSGIPGLYVLGLPNSAVAAGRWVAVSLDGPPGTHCPPTLLELDAVDYQDGQALGLSRLDADVSSRLAPETAARTLKVDASGHAAIDWGSVANPDSTVALTATTIAGGGGGGSIATPVNFDKLAIDASGRVTAAVADKAGFALAADGLDMISVVNPGHPVNWTTLPAMVAGLVANEMNRRTLSGGYLRIYMADGTTVAYARPATNDGITQVLGPPGPPTP